MSLTRSSLLFACAALFTLGFWSCETDSPIDSSPAQRTTLEYYLNQRSGMGLSRQLIACAAGGRAFAENDNPEKPVSIFYLPVEGATDIRYWETDSIEVDPDSLLPYRERSLERLPVFGGFLGRFTRSNPGKELWCRITYLTADSVHVCNAIRLKMPDEPTLVAHSAVDIRETRPGYPKFTWEDPSSENVIYFQVISDAAGDLLTGTYTFDQNWQFYDLNNVVININDIYTNPQLSPLAKYQFTLMGVSVDNWVHTFASKPFVIEP